MTRVCKRDHDYEPGNGCPECHRIICKEYRARRRREDPAQRERERAAARERYADPDIKARMLEQARVKYHGDEAHRESAKIKARERKREYAKDPEYLAGKVRKERARLDAIQADPVRHAKFLEAQRRRIHKRRALLACSDSPGVTAQEWLDICERFQDAEGVVRCAYCSVNPGNEIDHVVPISRGGKDEPSNVVPCCKRCNCSKNDRLLSEWHRPYLRLVSG